MLRRQHYKEFIQEQGQLQSTAAQSWGYKLDPQQFIPTNKRVKHKVKVTKIDPIKHTLPLPPSNALLKVDQQLRMLENQRKLNQLTEKAKQDLQKGVKETDIESAAIKMMNQRFQEYNFLLEHRHIIEKNSEKARQILGIKKSKKQIIEEEIAALKQQLNKSNFSDIITINKKITKLYRQYQKVIDPSYRQKTELSLSLRTSSPFRAKTQQSATSYPTSNINTSKLSPGLRTNKKSSFKTGQPPKKSDKEIQVKDLIIMQELKESSDGDPFLRQSQKALELKQPKQVQSAILGHKFFSMQRRKTQIQQRPRFNTLTQEEATKQKMKEKMNKTLTQNFVSKELMKKGEKLDKFIEEHEDVADVWKQRVDTNKQENMERLQRCSSSRKKRNPKSVMKETKLKEQAQNKTKQRLQKAKKLLKYHMDQVKKDMTQKQKVLSLVIRKKQSKYQKIPGTQFLKKNDPNQQAKVYLGTSGHKKTQYNQWGRQSSVHKQQIRQEEGIPEWLNIQKESEQLYWAMLRNEKINILLKNNR